MPVIASIRIISPGEDPIDMRDGPIEYLIGSQRRGIDDQGIRGRRQRRYGTILVAGITFLHILQNPRVYSPWPLVLQLFESALGAGLGRSRDEKLHRGVR